MGVGDRERGSMSTTRALTAVVAAAALIGLAACGGDNSSSNSATTAAAATTSASASAAAGAETTAAGGGPTTAAPQKADPNKPPVLVGFHNLEGGSISLPEIRLAFLSGINYVNEELGGINGRPMKALTCNLEPTPESSVKCANEFVEKNVVVAVQGVDPSAD